MTRTSRLRYDKSPPADSKRRAGARPTNLSIENIKTALASAGAKFEDVVKMTVYLTDIRTQLPLDRDMRDKYVSKSAPPASTTIEISRLVREGGLIEVDVTAVVPTR